MPRSSQTQVPPLSLFLAYLPMVVLMAAALAVWALPPAWSQSLARAAIIWAGAILAFLSGVRRGLSFRQPGGPTAAQLLTMLSLFVLAACALLSPWHIPAVVLLLIGYSCTALLDPIAAEQHEVPRFFAVLRPPQMLLPVLSLLLLGAFYLWRA